MPIPSPALLAGEGEGEGTMSGPSGPLGLALQGHPKNRYPHLNPLPRVMRERRLRVERASGNSRRVFQRASMRRLPLVKGRRPTWRPRFDTVLSPAWLPFALSRVRFHRGPVHTGVRRCRALQSASRARSSSPLAQSHEHGVAQFFEPCLIRCLGSRKCHFLFYARLACCSSA